MDSDNKTDFIKHISSTRSNFLKTSMMLRLSDYWKANALILPSSAEFCTPIGAARRQLAKDAKGAYKLIDKSKPSKAALAVKAWRRDIHATRARTPRSFLLGVNGIYVDTRPFVIETEGMGIPKSVYETNNDAKPRKKKKKKKWPSGD